MKLQDVQSILNATCITGPNGWETVEVKAACGSDLMSDVLAFVKDQGILLTGLVNPQVIRTAEMMDIKVIVFVRGKTPGDEVIALAKELDMVILCTNKPLYVACGNLYTHGLPGSREDD